MHKYIMLAALYIVFGFENLCFSSSPLSLEEKIGQLLMVHFHGTEANEEAKTLIQEAHVGAFIFYNWSNELSSREQVTTLCSSLQHINRVANSRIPLLFAVDQEGGRVVRLKKGFTHFPSNREIAETDRPELAFEAAQVTAKELKSVGIHMNMAPVLDVSSNPQASIIGNRSYGSDPETVCRFGKAALQGYRSNQLLAVVKHFPGHGDAVSDSHATLPFINKTRKEMDTIELHPFYKLLPETEAIMTGHLFIPSLDSVLPATLSYDILTKLLREEWNYDGLILSDSLIMKGISNKASSIEEICLQALQAGCDILCLGGKLLNEAAQDELKVEDFIKIHRFLVKAVQQGTLSEEKIDQSVNRILKAKQKYCAPFDEQSASSLDPQIILSEIALLRRLNREIPEQQLHEIANRIWHNEGKSETHLLFWNPSENFLSLGIGHFIWYPEDNEKIYEEGFPAYLAYLKKNNHKLPHWLDSIPSCPWKNRDDFLKKESAKQVQELKEWIIETRTHQASFMLYRLQTTIFHMIHQSPAHLQKRLLENFHSLAQTSQGLYILIDYLNFKGSGLHPHEQYNNKGWGLIQVLTEMSDDDSIPIVDRFVDKASELLTTRTQNAPEGKNEQKFLHGWLERLQTYKK